MPVGQQLISVLAPIKELVAGFAITGYLIYSLPISSLALLCCRLCSLCFLSFLRGRRDQGQVQFVAPRPDAARSRVQST